MDTFLIVDIEATCWAEDDPEKGEMEVIQFGIVCVDGKGRPISVLEGLVKPVQGKVSEFCTDLTGIKPEDIEGAAEFPKVTELICEWLERIGQEPVAWYSWGEWDMRQLRKECNDKGAVFPFPAEHRNAKKLFQKKRLKSKRQVGLRKALEIMDMEFNGDHHNALDDAINVSRLMPFFHIAPQDVDYDCLIREAWLLKFQDVPEEYQDTQILTGLVVKDHKGRFPADRLFKSSPVQSVDCDTVTTMNTVYKCLGEIQEATIPATALFWIMQGMPIAEAVAVALAEAGMPISDATN